MKLLDSIFGFQKPISSQKRFSKYVCTLYDFFEYQHPRAYCAGHQLETHRGHAITTTQTKRRIAAVNGDSLLRPIFTTIAYCEFMVD
jgi:hypothetical protein